MGVAHLFSQLDKLLPQSNLASLISIPEVNVKSTRMAEASTSTVVSLTDKERVSKLYNKHMSMLQTTSTPCCSEASTLSGCLWTLHVKAFEIATYMDTQAEN